MYIRDTVRWPIRLETPMLWALGFLGTFLIGGVTGAFRVQWLRPLHARHILRSRISTTFNQVRLSACCRSTYWYEDVWSP